MDAIDIGTVLNKFNDTYDEQSNQVKNYGIRFITSDGRYRTMDKSRKNIKSPKQKLATALQKRAKGLFNLQAHGTILLHDLSIAAARTVKVAAICEFKDFGSSTWLRVRH